LDERENISKYLDNLELGTIFYPSFAIDHGISLFPSQNFLMGGIEMGQAYRQKGDRKLDRSKIRSFQISYQIL